MTFLRRVWRWLNTAQRDRAEFHERIAALKARGEQQQRQLALLEKEMRRR